MDIVNAKPKQATKVAKRRLPKPKLIAAVVLAILLLVAWSSLRSQTSARAIDKDSYQAVFLSNGQVYFGKLVNLNGEYVDMREIYYLQLQNSDSENAAEAVSNPDSSNNDIKLIKLGNELHGPTDRMMINKSQILFWENLKGDSKVSQAIEQYKNDNK